MDSRSERLVPASSGHVAALFSRLSPAHLREIRATGGLSAKAALETSVASSLEAYAYLSRGTGAPLFMFGVEAAGSITGTALVWMLAAPEIARDGAGVVRAARWGVARAFSVSGASRLEQYVPEWYGVGLRFAKRLGFAMEVCEFSGRDGSALFRIFLERSEFERTQAERIRKWVR